MRSSAERYRAPRLLAKLRAWTICACCEGVIWMWGGIEGGSQVNVPPEWMSREDQVEKQVDTY